MSVEGVKRLGGISLAWAAIQLAVGLAPVAAAGEEVDLVSSMYSPESVAEIELDLPQASIEALEAEPDEYQPATFALKVGAATYGPYAVGARLKGGVGSFRPLPGKAGLKVKFDEYVDGQTFFGLEKLTLNNMVQDPSMVHETLTYELSRSLGVPAPRTGYAFVWLNGEAYGVYLNVETLDAVSLPRWFATTLHLYEGQAGLDVSPGAALDFEVDEGKSKKREDLEALILAANSDLGDWSDGMVAVADLTEMTRMWAVERYVGHWDGYAGADAEFDRPNNYYLHSVESGLFQMLPWGVDQTWESRLEFDEPAGGLLFNECYADASCKALYVDALLDLQASIADLDLDLDSLASCIAERLAPWQAMEDDQRRQYDAEGIAHGVAEAREFIEERPAELADWLGADAPAAATGRAPCSGPERAPASGPLAGPLPEGPGPSLQLGRIGVGRGALTARLQASVPGQVDLRATIRTRQGTVPACAATQAVAVPGPISVRCNLSQAVRRRLELRWLRLRLDASLTPLADPSVAVEATVRVPRSGAPSRRHLAS